MYLTDEEIAGLQRASAATGRSTSDLIREGVQTVTDRVGKRRFASRGIGEGSGEPVAEEFEEYLRAAWSRRDTDS
ncbi:MAG TPA: ribbon-helix-helix protein, CopG family [Chloroflexota bacterium]|nr:ribbon-helix-helix protein, CopG family [Chloroflexota bacterium]